jgi:hypothetical protein
MSKTLDIAVKLLNIEKHNTVRTNAPGKKYVPVSVVRGLAHELIVELREREVMDKELLKKLQSTEAVLKQLNAIG